MKGTSQKFEINLPDFYFKKNQSYKKVGYDTDLHKVLQLLLEMFLMWCRQYTKETTIYVCMPCNIFTTH